VRICAASTEAIPRHHATLPQHWQAVASDHVSYGLFGFYVLVKFVVVFVVIAMNATNATTTIKNANDDVVMISMIAMQPCEVVCFDGAAGTDDGGFFEFGGGSSAGICAGDLLDGLVIPSGIFLAFRPWPSLLLVPCWSLLRQRVTFTKLQNV